MMLADVVRALFISFNALLFGLLWAAFRRLGKLAGEQRKLDPAPVWVNLLFIGGIMMLSIGSAINAWMHLGEPFSVGRAITVAGMMLLIGGLVHFLLHLGRQK